jgi:hypothetical protein
MSEKGALSAFKGYSSQTLYILHRILIDNKDLVFIPETNEDLSIYDANKNLLEVIQVKDINSNLCLSDLGDHFFKRVKSYYQIKAPIKIVSFGKIGPELLNALNGNRQDYFVIINKLKESYSLSQSEADYFLENLKIEIAIKAELKKEISNYCCNSIAIFQEKLAYDLFVQWIFQASQNQSEVTKAAINAKLVDLVTSLNETHDYLKTIGNEIRPIFNDSLLSEELIKANISRYKNDYYLGMRATPAHIMAGVDIYRDDKISQIVNDFEKSEICIIHGASGQGKSSLAYRYLHDFCSISYEISDYPISNISAIISTLKRLAQNLKVKIPIYLDVKPGQKAWVEIAKEISKYPDNFKFLITIREEEWNTTQISSHYFIFKDLSLVFDKLEASLIYQKFEETKEILQIPTFEDAWRQFGGSGPLLEFVYLLTQGDTLRSRLSEQIKQYTDINRKKFLQIISFAGQFNISIYGTRIMNLLEINDIDFGKIINQFNKEHFIRKVNEKEIEALHPIRAKILLELLSNEYSNIETIAQLCLNVISEKQFEIFLKNFFFYYDLSGDLINSLNEHGFQCWSGVAGTLRALLWLGMYCYIKENKEIIEKAARDTKEGWSFCGPSDFMGISEYRDGWQSILESINPVASNAILAFYRQFTPHENVFRYAKAFSFSIQKIPLNSITTENEIEDLGQSLYWFGFFKVEKDINLKLIANVAFPPDKVAFFYYGLFHYSPKLFLEFQPERLKTIEFFQKEYEVPFIEDNSNEVILHFIQTDKIKNLGNEKYSHNWLVMQRIDIAHLLFPDKDYYAAQPYGFNYEHLGIEYHPPIKRIEKKNMRFDWDTYVNRHFHGLGNASFRPRNWLDFFKRWYNCKETYLEIIEIFIGVLEIWLKNRGPIRESFFDDVNSLINELNDLHLLPLDAVDKFGGVTEVSDNKNLSEGIGLEIHKPLLKGIKDYSNSIEIFLSQCNKVLYCFLVLHDEKRDEYTNYANTMLTSLKDAFLSGSKLNKLLQTNYRKYSAERNLQIDEIKHLRLFELYNTAILLRQFLTISNINKLISDELAIIDNLKTRLPYELSKKGFAIKINCIDRSLFLFSDTEHILKYPSTFGEIVIAMISIIGRHKFVSLRRMVLLNLYDNIYIIPLYKSKLFIEHMLFQTDFFRLFDTDILNSNPLFNFTYDITAIDLKVQFSIESWSNSYVDIKHIHKLFEKVNVLWNNVNYVAQISELLKKIPEDSVIGPDILRNKLKELLAERWLQDIFDEVNHIYKAWESEPQSEAANEYIKSEVLQLLKEIRIKLIPPNTSFVNDKIETTITTDEFANWAIILNKEVHSIHESIFKLGSILMAIHANDQIIIDAMNDS